jgi:hypothetical protein
VEFRSTKEKFVWYDPVRWVVIWVMIRSLLQYNTTQQLSIYSNITLQYIHHDNRGMKIQNMDNLFLCSIRMGHIYQHVIIVVLQLRTQPNFENV